MNRHTTTETEHMINTSPSQGLPMKLRLFTVLVAAVVLTACGSQSNENTPSDQRLTQLRAERSKLDDQIRTMEKALGKGAETTTGTVPVTVFTTNEGSFAHTIDIKGSVDSRSSVTITPKTGGTITRITVVNGQSVSKGQLLVEFDNELTKRSMEEVQTQLDFANTVYEKQRRIYEAKAGSEISYLQAKNQKESLERRMSSLKEQLELSRLYAPVAGVADNVLPRVGENAGPGQPLMTIVNTGDMRVIADVAEAYVANISQGDPVKIMFPEINDTIQTRLGIVSTTVNTISRTFRVEIPIRPVPKNLRPNITCNLVINDLTIPKAITIPLKSVAREEEHSFAYVVNEKNVVSRRTISTGLVSGGMVQVTEGLQPGERVVVSGVLDVADGQKVRVVE